MQNKTIRRFLAAAMTAAVAVTSMPLQNAVYAAETKQAETEEATPSETSEAIAEVQTAEDADSTGDGNEQPAIGDVVKKHTINVIPDDPESENTEGKDTYWKLKWSDEFDGTALDTTKWDYQYGNGSVFGVAGWGNNEKQWYTDGTTDNVKVEDGSLIITAKKDSAHGDGTTYSSGKLYTLGNDYFFDSENNEPLFSTKYGRVEAKMTLPAGTGYWPAFWMMPVDSVYTGWPCSGEIDIMEARGRLTGSVDGTIHYGNTYPNKKSSGGSYNSNMKGDNAQNFDMTEEHVYALEWLPGCMKWYVDDECFYTATNWFSTTEKNADNFTYPAPFDQQFYILLNLAVGGDYDGGRLDETIDNVQMKVDYVRVYDLCDDAEGTVHDYTADEKTVTAASSSSTGALLGGVVGETNFLSGDLTQARKVSGDDTPENKGWYLMAGTGGDASVAAADGGAKVSIGAAGQNTYSVQLMHQFPLTQGYEYELTFDAKADKEKSITAQMSDYVYTSFIGSWSKYSDAFSVPLTKNWKTYTYHFVMTDATDEAARLELNLGAGTTDSVYFRNASLKAIGAYEGESEDKEKEPLKSGEHIYNGTFDQGNNQNEQKEYTRLRFWKTIGGATAVVDGGTREVSLGAGTSAEAGIEQINVQMLQADTYQITFDADADAERTFTVKTVGNDGTVYADKALTLPAGKSAQEVTFTVPAGQTVQYGTVQFLTGTDATGVRLDNISMKRLTNLNVDYSNIKVYPLKNGSFANGLDGWTGYNGTPVSVENGVCTVTASNTGAEPWNRMLVSDFIQMQEGLSYTLKYDIKADKANQTITAKIETTDGSYHALCSEEFAPTTSWQTHEINFIADRSGSMEFKYILGSVTTETNISLRNISLCVANTPIKQAPDMVVTGIKRVGEDLVLPLTYAAGTEEAYLAAEKTAVITAEDGSETTVTPIVSGAALTIPKTAFAKEGKYAVRINTKGFDYTEFDVTVYPEGDNLLLNGDFSKGLTGWTTFTNTDGNANCGTISVTPSGELEIAHTWSNNSWDILLGQHGLPLTSGEWYELTFDARSTIDRLLQVTFGNDADGAASDVVYTVKTGNEYHTYTVYWQATRNNPKVELLAGNIKSGGISTPTDPHMIYVDNLSIKKMSEEDKNNMIPTVTSKGAVKLGEDAELKLTNVKAAWSAANKIVYVNGKQVEDAAIDGEDVLISASAFKQTGYYEVTIKAEGFPDTNVAFQRILVPGVQEFLENGDFSQGSTGWQTYQLNTDNGGIEYKNGKAVITINYTSYSEWGPAGWTTQLIQKPTGLEAGKAYVLNFQASTDLVKGKKITVEIKAGNTVSETFALTDEMQSFHMNFTPSQSDIEIGFFCGNTQTDLDNYADTTDAKDQAVPPHTITISNASLTLAGAAEEEGVTAYRIEHYLEKGGSYVLDKVSQGVAATDSVVDAAADGLYLGYEGYEPVTTVAGSVTSGNVGNVSNSLTLKLYYKAKTYKVTYVLNNPAAKNSLFNKSKYSFGTGLALKDASCSGKVFNGWYFDEACTRYTNCIPTNQTGDVTLYAAWRDPRPDEIVVTGVTINKTALTLKKGASETLTATVAPANAGNKNVTWSTANAAVAAVDSNGTVTAVAKGSTEITVTTEDGGYTASCTVTVTEDGTNVTPAKVAVSEVRLNQTSLSLNKGDVATLTATVAPQNASDKNVTWTSSNPQTATVDAAGKVTAVAKGTAVITAQAGGKTASCVVTVKIPASKVKLNTKTVYMVKGKTLKLKATMTPADTTDTLSIRNSKQSVATAALKGNIVTIKAKKVGKTTVTIQTTSQKSFKCTINVVKKATKSTKIKLNKKTLNLKKGESYDLVPTLTKKTSTDTIKWSSSNKKVAAVDAYGTVTGKKGGTVTITAKTSSGKKATCKVTIKVAAEKVKLTKTKLTIKKGAVTTLKAKLTPSDATDKLAWTTSNKKVVTVDKNGKIKGIKKGTATITVKAGGKKATCKITVK